MKKNNKKIDIIIIIFILLIIAAVIIAIVAQPNEKNNTPKKDVSQLTAADFAEKTFGVHTGTLYEGFIKKNYPKASINYYHTLPDMIPALQTGLIDAFLVNRPTAEQLSRDNPGITMLKDPVGSSEYGMIFPKTEAGDKIRAQMDEYITKLKKSGELDELIAFWSTEKAKTTYIDMSGLTGKNGTLRMATSGDSVPDTFLVEGKPAGYDPDIAVRFCREYGYNIEITVTDFSGILPGLASGIYDFAASGIAISDERKESVNFSVPDYSSEIYMMVKNTSSGTVKYTDYVGKRIGILTGSSFEEPTLEFFPNSEYLYLDSASDLVMALIQNKIDGFVEDEPVLRTMCLNQPELAYLKDILKKEEYSFCFPKSGQRSDQYLKQFNDMLSELSADGTLDKLNKKWFAKDYASLKIDTSGLTGENGNINVAVIPTNIPFAMVSDGELSGMAVELMTMFCRKYGYTCTYDMTNISSALAGVTSGIYDICANNSTVTPERKETIRFSDPIYVGGIALAVRASDVASENTAVEDRPFSYYAENKKIGVLTGGLYEVMIKERFPDADLYQYNNQPDMAVALSSGIIDAFTCPESSAKDFIKADPTLTYLKEVFTTIPYGFAFEKSEDKEYLRDQMNEFLKKIHDDGTYDKIVSVWFGNDESAKTVDFSGLTGENGTIRYMTAPTMQPFSYISNGANAGLEIDLAVRFCREYGYDITFDNGEFASLIPGITSGMYDIASGTIMITEERAKSVNFSEPYYITNAVAVVKKENTDNTPDAVNSFFSSIASSFEKNFIRENRWQLILEGIGTTCIITVMSALAGTVLAFLICMFRRTGSRLANVISNIYVKLLQGTPMVVLLMILYYVILGKSGLSAVWVAVVGFSLNFGAYASEIMRSGIESIDGGQREAALALGYSENQTFFRFIFPQAVVRFLPVYNGEIISLLKSTSIVGYIAIQDLTKMSDIIRSRTYEAFFPLIVTAIIYFILAWIISMILKLILKAVRPKRRKAAEK